MEESSIKNYVKYKADKTYGSIICMLWKTGRACCIFALLLDFLPKCLF